MDRGLVFDLQRFSPHDGPGIRTTVFLKGCPLRCAWCHNPESKLSTPELLIRPARCAECGECVEACDEGLAYPAAKRSLPASGCVLCGACVEACPAAAREILGREWTVSALVPQLLRDRVFFEESGGGVTFSGGEPLMQAGFLQRCLEELREQGVHAAVDTCGYASHEALLSVAPLTDLFLFDVKIVDDERHRLYTGLSNQSILANLRSLAEIHARIWLRFPVIPGFNDDEANLEATVSLAGSLAGVRRVCLLPYHRTGTGKFRPDAGRSAIAELTPPSLDRLESIAARFSAAGLTTSIGG